MARLHIGLSGFAYKEWQGEGLFYPPGLKSAEFFRHYSRRVNALEGVGMMYKMPTAAAMEKWAAESPDGFKVSPKMNQQVTHFQRLKPSSYESARVFVDAMSPLEKANKLGPILLQLPPNMQRDDDLLTTFLQNVPQRDTVRWSMEFRNASWNCTEVEQILREHGVGWVAVEDDEADAQFRDTADHVYIRLRRLTYSDAQIQIWATLIKQKLSDGKDCYVYCRHKDTESPWLWVEKLQALVN